MAGTVLASAERSYRNPDNRKVPVSWGAEIAEGDFSSLPYTCVLDLIEARGRVDEQEPLYDGIADAEVIGDYMGLSREMVRLDLRRGIQKCCAADEDVGEFLLMAYEKSNLNRRRRK
jgi:hypothetical protein